MVKWPEAGQIRRAQETECPELIMKAAAVVNEVGATQNLELCSCRLAHANTKNIMNINEYHVLTIGASNTNCFSARDSSQSQLSCLKRNVAKKQLAGTFQSAKPPSQTNSGQQLERQKCSLAVISIYNII